MTSIAKSFQEFTMDAREDIHWWRGLILALVHWFLVEFGKMLPYILAGLIIGIGIKHL